MSTLVPDQRSAWFSSSVPKSKVKIWVECGCFVEPDPFQADFLFSDNSDAADTKRIFKDKEFLKGHLTVFSSDFIEHAAKEKIVSKFDVMNCIHLPQKKFDDLGISSLCLRENKVGKTCSKDRHSSDRRVKKTSKKDCSTSKKSNTKNKETLLRSIFTTSPSTSTETSTKDHSTSTKSITRNEVPKRSFTTPWEKKRAEQSSNNDSISRFHFSDHRFEQTWRKDCSTSKKSITRNKVSRRSFTTQTKKKQVEQFTSNADDCTPQPSSTLGTQSRENTPKDINDGVTDGANEGTDDGANDGTNNDVNDGTNNGSTDGTNDGTNDGANDGTNNDVNGGTNNGSTDGTNDGANDDTNDGANNGANDGTTDGANHHCGIFYHSLNFEMTHIDDIDVPRVKLMDFKPGVGGCSVVKRRTLSYVR